MKKQVQDVAEVFSGYHFRERLYVDPNGSVAVIQTKDVQAGVIQPSRNFARVPAFAAVQRLRVRNGDVLLKSRGDSYFSAVVRGDFEATVVAAPLLVLRANTKFVLPGYLRWFLNHPATQSLMRASATGAQVLAVSKNVVASLEIPLPSIEKQAAIEQLADLAQQESELMEKIAERHRAFVDGILWQQARDTR